MKKLCLLFLLSGISIHAMDTSLCIVPFDQEKHYTATHAILSQVISRPDCIIHAPKIVKRILVNKAIASDHPDYVLGVIAYKTTQYPTLTHTFISALAIAPQYQHKGYGAGLIQYVESLPPEKEGHIIELCAASGNQSFYRQLGYVGQFYMEKRMNLPMF